MPRSKKKPKSKIKSQKGVTYGGEWPKKVIMQWESELVFRKPPKIKDIKFDKDIMTVEFVGGFSMNWNYYSVKTLKEASYEQLARWRVDEGSNIAWDELDEHLSIVSFLGPYG